MLSISAFFSANTIYLSLQNIFEWDERNVIKNLNLGSTQFTVSCFVVTILSVRNCVASSIKNIRWPVRDTLLP